MENCKDPILEESKFCEDCEPKVLQLVEYVRQLENVQIVAKQALETIKLANDKLTVERKGYVKRIKELEDKLSGKSATDLKKKMQTIENAHQRFTNRDRLIQ